MNAQVESLLVELRLSMRDLEDEKVEQVLNEVRTHLDASIQARIELGLAESEATAEAIKAFGTPIVAAKQVIDQQKIMRRDHGYVGAVFLFIAAYLAIQNGDFVHFWIRFLEVPRFLVYDDILDRCHSLGISILALIGLAILARQGWRAKTITARRFLLTSIPLILLLSAVLGLSFVSMPGDSPAFMRVGLSESAGRGDRVFVARSEVDQLIPFYNDCLQNLRPPTIDPRLVEAVDIFARGRAAVLNSQFFSDRGFLKYDYTNGPPFASWTKNFRIAESSWRDYDMYLRWIPANEEMERNQLREAISALGQVRQSRLDAPSLMEGVSIGAFLAAVSFFATLTAWFVRATYELNRKLRLDAHLKRGSFGGPISG